jgi:hypothetical protein
LCFRGRPRQSCRPNGCVALGGEASPPFKMGPTMPVPLPRIFCGARDFVGCKEQCPARAKASVTSSWRLKPTAAPGRPKELPDQVPCLQRSDRRALALSSLTRS